MYVLIKTFPILFNFILVSWEKTYKLISAVKYQYFKKWHKKKRPERASADVEPSSKFRLPTAFQALKQLYQTHVPTCGLCPYFGLIAPTTAYVRAVLPAPDIPS